MPAAKKNLASNSMPGESTIDVYALFDDGSAAKIMLSAFSQREGFKPTVESTAADLALRKSAERGFYSALGHYHARGLPPYPGHQVVWEFAGSAHEFDNYTGSSSGLAFFVQFLVLFLQPQGAPRKSFSVAATGELSDLTVRAQVHAILSLEDKLKAAFTVLKPGDIAFYPAENKGIPPALLRIAQRKGIEIKAIATTQEMAEIIYNWFESKKDPSCSWWHRMIAYIRKPVRLFLFMAFSLFCIGVVLISRQGLDQAQLIYAIERGDFSAIPIERLQTENDPSLRGLVQQARTPLLIKSSFIYLADEQPTFQDVATLNRMKNIQLEKGAGYRFEVQVDPSCYFYLFQFEGDASVDLLFPLSTFDLDDHYLRDHQVYMIPGDTKYFYFKSTGVRRLVTLCFLGSSWRANDLEELCQAYDRTSNDAEKKIIRNRILLQIQKRSQALKNGWQGLFYQQSCFWRQ